MEVPHQITTLADQLAIRYASVPEVEAVALAGSHMAPFADAHSDIDLYVYVSQVVSLASRAEIAAGASRAEIGNEFWEPGDEWIDAHTGVSVDVMFRSTPWMEDQLDRVLRRHQASIGYSTCFWYNLKHSRALFDRTGWLAALQRKSEQPYPMELQRAIIAKNYPILRSNISSYLHQIELALRRKDSLSINHRLTALLASYFDILFAVNKQPHPGEKRLVQISQSLCHKLPLGMDAQLSSLLSSTPGQLLTNLNALLDNLDALLMSEGLRP